MGAMGQNEFLFRNINWFFSCLFPAEGRYVGDHPSLCGKFIPQSGRKLPTFGIFSGIGVGSLWK
jgi:hypothetical protein